MKKALFILLSLSVAAGLYALIGGSAHDFSDGTGFNADAWNNGTSGQLCQPCHTPHNGDATITDAPLWNHTESTQTFVNYGAGYDMQAAVGDPAGVSLLCLSCHDGVTALDSFGGTAGTVPLSGSANVGLDLSNDHPISITYNAALVALDSELHDPTLTTSGLGANIDDDMLEGAGNNLLECSSCHDVHNTANVANLLRKSNVQSALCLTCHNK